MYWFEIWCAASTHAMRVVTQESDEHLQGQGQHGLCAESMELLFEAVWCCS
jgi:hypothetical protein